MRFALPAGLLLALVSAFLAFGRRPSRRGAREEWRTFKSRLPAWTKRVETVVHLTLWIALVAKLSPALDQLYIQRHPYIAMIPDEPGLIDLISAFAVGWPSAALAANLVSYLVAPVRKINLAAMEGLPVVSLRRANIELAQMALGTVLICTPFVLYAAFHN